MQHSLLLALNISTSTRFSEEKPNGNTKLPVIKYPLYESIARMNSMKNDIEKYAHVVVYMTRDKPNTVWSLVKRYNKITPDAAQKWSKDFCEKTAWWKAQHFRVPVINIHIVNFTLASDKVMRYILQVHDENKKIKTNTNHSGRRLKSTNTIYSFPKDVDHNKLRIHQIHSNISTPDLNTYHKECKNIYIVSELLKEC